MLRSWLELEICDRKGIQLFYGSATRQSWTDLAENQEIFSCSSEI